MFRILDNPKLMITSQWLVSLRVLLGMKQYETVLFDMIPVPAPVPLSSIHPSCMVVRVIVLAHERLPGKDSA